MPFFLVMKPNNFCIVPSCLVWARLGTSPPLSPVNKSNINFPLTILMHNQQKTQKAMRTNKITTKRKMPLLKTGKCMRISGEFV